MYINLKLNFMLGGQIFHSYTSRAFLKFNADSLVRILILILNYFELFWIVLNSNLGKKTKNYCHAHIEILTF